jgi:serine/threonine protein phosphatase 1
MIYAIGDIHGSYDPLLKLHRKIMDHASNVNEEHIVVYLGDYIDRGPDNKKVIDWIKTKPFNGFKEIRLRGNHEQMCLDAYNDRGNIPKIKFWTDNGGKETLRDYDSKPWDIANRKSKDPKELLEFINTTSLYFVRGRFLFVHAGFNPKRKFLNQQQDKNVLMWIRNEFLLDTDPFEYFVIHGHTPIMFDPRSGQEDIAKKLITGEDLKLPQKPLLLNNRANLDTGAVWTGVLSCAIVDNNGKTFMGFLTS